MMDAIQTKKDIQEKKNEISKMLRDFSRSQVELWRQVPALAEEISRLEGVVTGCYLLATRCFQWPLSRQWPVKLFVNLQTGELMGEVEEIQLSNLALISQQLDAVLVILGLKEKIEKLKTAATEQKRD